MPLILNSYYQKKCSRSQGDDVSKIKHKVYGQWLYGCCSLRDGLITLYACMLTPKGGFGIWAQGGAGYRRLSPKLVWI